MNHDFFQIASTALIEDISKKIRPFADKIGQPVPVYIPNTGDEVFLTTMYKDATKQLYDRTPSLKLDVSSVNPDFSQFTNYWNVGQFNDEIGGFKKPLRSSFRRIPLDVVFNGEMYFNNITEYFMFLEIIMMTTMVKPSNQFDFYYLDKKFMGSYNMLSSFDSSANLQLGFDHEKRRRTLPIPFEVNLQYPAFSYYDVSGLGADKDKVATGVTPAQGEVTLSDDVLPENGYMQKLIHNVHQRVEGRETITNEITKSKNQNNEK